ncbi:hypothetical protein ACIF80_23650 [Streptomyces sp. NPDC085927]|uniref:hypothetical protein n=1 Tax=Streptomyces sp. NPDC085927 TaxID=3365738 RepID=UPI0037D7E8C5
MRAAPTYGYGAGDVRAGRVADPSRPGTTQVPSDSGGTTPSPPTRPDRREQRGAPARSTLTLAIICVGYFMVILDHGHGLAEPPRPAHALPDGSALPMVLIGAGQGLAPAPLVSSGVDGVAPEDAGAGSGPVNTVHQAGSALSLSILTAVAAAVSTGRAAADIASRSGAALTGSAALLTLAIMTVLTLIVPARATRNERFL